MNSLEIRKSTEPYSNALKWDFSSIDEAIRISKLIHEKFKSEYQVYMDELGNSYNVVYVNVWADKGIPGQFTNPFASWYKEEIYGELVSFIENEIINK